MAKGNARVNQFIDQTVNVVSDFLVEELSIEKSLAIEGARECAHRIAAVFGGSLLYVPKDTGYKLPERDEDIYNRFNGQNLHELMSEFKLTHTRIYQIVARVRASKRVITLKASEAGE